MTSAVVWRRIRGAVSRMAKGRTFETGTKSWTSSRDSADGTALIIELDVDGRIKTMTVPKEPLELRSSNPSPGFLPASERI